MAKKRTESHECTNCGKKYTKWVGRCNGCGNWNTVEEKQAEASGTGTFGFGRQARGKGMMAANNPPIRLSEIEAHAYERVSLPMKEFTRVLGGGIVPGSLVLVGGDPGIGKCLAGSSRVFDPLSGAYLPITQWATGHKSVLAIDPQTLQLKPASVVAFHERGVRAVVEIKTKLGRTLKATRTHPLLTPNGWRAVGELMAGSAIASPSGLPYFGNESLPEATIKQIANMRHHSLPPSIFRLPRTELALFLNHLFDTDQWLSVHKHGQQKLSYYTTSYRLAEDIQHLLLRFGLIASLEHVQSTVNRHAQKAYEVEVLGTSSQLHDHDVYWDEIVSILPAGSEAVYDLSVPQKANFVANDLIVHNSTLLGQVSGMMADAMGPILYLSGEESVYQVKMRAERLGIGDKDVYLLSETNLDVAIEHIKTLRPKAAIIDSIQTIYLGDITSSAGSITQVRECSARLMQLAKGDNMPVFLVGHVTKEGSIAGPRVLEHIVDTVLYLEGDRFHTFRLLRAQKNRFGSTHEVGVFEMIEGGMVEVPNPSEAFLANHQAGATGSAVAVTMEGTRPILIEIQSLVTQSAFSQPRRTANGVDMNRLHLLLAVLAKRVGLELQNQDVFVNIVGGLKITEPAADLSIAAAIASSYRDQAIPRDVALIGEIGLGGELRSVSQIDKRLHETAKLGFKRCIVPRTGRRPVQVDGIETITVKTVVEALYVILKPDSEKPSSS
ncbi:MAG: DNA repair protein RadA [Ardenticatenaceae bacterium]